MSPGCWRPDIKQQEQPKPVRPCQSSLELRACREDRQEDWQFPHGSMSAIPGERRELPRLANQQELGKGSGQNQEHSMQREGSVQRPKWEAEDSMAVCTVANSSLRSG